MGPGDDMSSIYYSIRPMSAANRPVCPFHPFPTPQNTMDESMQQLFNSMDSHTADFVASLRLNLSSIDLIKVSAADACPSQMNGNFCHVWIYSLRESQICQIHSSRISKQNTNWLANLRKSDESESISMDNYYTGAVGAATGGDRFPAIYHCNVQ